MTEKPDQAKTPEERAEEVARDLVDTGRPVTARAVREAAGVRMAVAADVARAWREAAADEPEVVVPPVPEDVTGRLRAIWGDAYRAAVATVSPERDRLGRRVKELEDEVEQTIAAVTSLEDDKERAGLEISNANARAEQADARADKFRLETREAESRTTAAENRAAAEEARAIAAETERERAEARITALIERIPDLRKDDA